MGRRVYRWIHEGSDGDKESIRDRLAFVNRGVVAFVGVMATIMGILLTVKQLLS